MKRLTRKMIPSIFIILALSLFAPVSFFNHPYNSLSTSHAATKKVRLNRTSLRLRHDGSYTLKVRGTYKKVTWSSSSKKVATVTSSGEVTAVGHGEVTIKAKVKIKKKKYKTLKCKVTIPYTFPNNYLREIHYQKHGISMGYQNAAAYELAAENVIKNKASLHKKEAEDGDDVYYLESTNEIVFVSTYGFIRTYFFPTKGKAYFDKT